MIYKREKSLFVLQKEYVWYINAFINVSVLVPICHHLKWFYENCSWSCMQTFCVQRDMIIK